ncbi:MAG: RimK family protein [Planctomycetaceae bacterium]
MSVLIVASEVTDWPFEIPGVEVIDAWTYLTSPEYAGGSKSQRVMNLCRSYRYQSTGYYVSLLAEARGHKPVPGVITLQDLKNRASVKVLSDELDELIQQNLGPLQSNEFTLSVYFGRNMARRYDRLALHLFNLFAAPLLRFEFARNDEGVWQIRKVQTPAPHTLPDSHKPFVAESAARYFSGRASAPRSRKRTRFDMAILHDPDEKQNAPSNEVALKRFIRAAREQDVYAELITKDDYGRLLEFDSLFIRETTFVNHHTYRFARRAAKEGMVVIDDPVSILRCTNKVYLAEMLARHKIDIPRSIVVHRENIHRIVEEFGFPCVLKRPDSAFSKGVVKIQSEDELKTKIADFLGDSELLIAQEFLPTTFDWRIGIIDQKPLYACRYFMAPGHWQIVRQDCDGRGRYGKTETLPVELAPRKAVKLALKAANLIGDGLYGVDVKESNGNFYIIEVNDNPNIDADSEDAILKEDLYSRIMEVFVRRMEQKRARIDD